MIASVVVIAVINEVAVDLVLAVVVVDVVVVDDDNDDDGANIFVDSTGVVLILSFLIFMLQSVHCCFS